MSSIAEIIWRKKKHPKPVLLFDGVPGYPKVFRTIFGTLGSTRKIVKTLEIPEKQVEAMEVHENREQLQLECIRYCGVYLASLISSSRQG